METVMKTLLDTLPDILYDKTKNILPSFLTVFFYILILIKPFLGKERIIKGKYLHFKTIRKEYFDDKINGCFAIQYYFKRYLHEDEIEYILNSTDAYRIFSLLKAAWGKYEFKDNKYTTNVRKRNYILPFIGYSISYFLLLSQIVFYREIFAMGINLYYYWIILIINICINGPLLITCSTSIRGINCARKLANVTNEKEKKNTKCFLSCFLSCFKKIPLLRCKNTKEKKQKKVPRRKSACPRFLALIINPTNRRNVCPHVCGNVCLIKCFVVCRRTKRRTTAVSHTFAEVYARLIT